MTPARRLSDLARRVVAPPRQPRAVPRHRHLLVLVSSVAVLTAACGGPGSNGADATEGGDRLSVVANFYPVEFLASRIGGPRVDVAGLTPAGTEPHDLALDGRRRADMQEADVVLYLGADFQPDVSDAVAQLPDGVRAVDLLQTPGIDLLPAPADLGKESLRGRKDPHVWLSPRRMSVMADAVAEAFAATDPDHASDYRSRAAALTDDLDGLVDRFRSRLADCRERTIVTSHAAFGYLAADDDLRQVAIAGLSPDDEPDPATLASITRAASAAGVSTVFFEESLRPDLAETVAREIGARTSLLAALEFQPAAGQDYLSVMDANLDRLTAGLECG